MLGIQTELGIVAKNLNVDGRYKAVSERDVLDSVKKLEDKYGIYSYPVERVPLEMPPYKDRLVLRLETTYRFVNIDNPDEYIDVISYGDGVDTLDKAPGKAMTYADKYALMKAYKISTGDDPDQSSSPEKGEIDKAAVASKKMATPEQEKTLRELLDAEQYDRMIRYNGVKSLSELTEETVTNLIVKIKNKNTKATKAKAEKTATVAEETPATKAKPIKSTLTK